MTVDCELCCARPAAVLASWTGWMFLCRECAELTRVIEPEEIQ